MERRTRVRRCPPGSTESRPTVARHVSKVGRDSVEPESCVRCSKTQFVQNACERPILRLSHKPGANRIRPHILPFLRITLILPKPMMKTAGLKFRRVPPREASEFSLPECDPGFDLDVIVHRRTEEMDVVWHDDIRADAPSVRGMPCSQQSIMNGWIRKTLRLSFRTHRDEHNRRVIARDDYTDSRSATWDESRHLSGSTESRPTRVAPTLVGRARLCRAWGKAHHR